MWSCLRNIRCVATEIEYDLRETTWLRVDKIPLPVDNWWQVYTKIYLSLIMFIDSE